jgi:hypothetical protein
MKTDIEYLKQLEIDLEVVAESARTVHAAPAPRRGGRADHGTWLRYVGAAAALLTLAWGVGFVAQGNLSDVFSGSSREAAMAASGTSSADVPDTATERAAREDDAGDLAGVALGDEEAPAPQGFAPFAPATTPSASPAPGTPSLGDQRGGAIAENGMAKIVRDGSLALTIPEGQFERRFDRLFQISTIYGGFVLSSETRGPASGSVILRIPAENFDDAIVQVRGLGKVVGSTVNGRDVTAEYIDQQARLTILQARRDALLALMAQANSIQETITVMNQLDDVQSEIEKIQGRLRYLDDQVAESTLRVDMRERQPKDEEQIQQDENDVDNPSLGRAWELAVQGTMNVLATAIVGLGYLLPLAIVGLLIFGIVRLVRRRDREAS